MPNLFNYETLDTYTFDDLHKGAIYSNYIPKSISKKRDYHIQVDELKTIFRLVNKSTGEVDSVVVLNYKKYHNQDFYEVKYTNSREIKKGFMEYLFHLITHEFKYVLISDDEHTLPGSMDFWLSLKRKKKFEIYIFNIETGYKRQYDNYPIEKIWGFDIDGDEDTKNFVFDNMWESRMITKEIYDFFIQNIHEIKDRRMIRLVCQENKDISK